MVSRLRDQQALDVQILMAYLALVLRSGAHKFGLGIADDALAYISDDGLDYLEYVYDDGSLNSDHLMDRVGITGFELPYEKGYDNSSRVN